MSTPAFRVDTITWPEHKDGLQIALPLANDPPALGDLLPVFDADYNLTQHRVVVVGWPQITLGPAVPWPARGRPSQLTRRVT